jgi:CHAD domain-containing protein
LHLSFLAMSFHLKHRRPIATELSKIVRSEFKGAIEQLGNGRPTQEAIHEARKSLKKIRAVLRLLQDALGGAYEKQNDRLRSAAHLLSSLRDADAAVQTMQSLRHQYRMVLTASVDHAVGRGLRRRKRRIKARAHVPVRRTIGTLRRSRISLPNRIRRAGSLAAVRQGIAAGYREARDAMKDVSPDADAAIFHLWRRRIKAHWYHVRLFERLHRTPRGRALALRRLEQWLGNDHNLDVLRHFLLDAPNRFGGARVTALVLGCIDKHQQHLRHEALTLGHRLFSAKPAEFRHAAAAWW